jgi:acyl carrier protein
VDLPQIHLTLSSPQAGLDSLGAVELRNALTSRFEISLPATVTFDHSTLAALSTFIARQLAPAADSAAAAAAAAADPKTARVKAEAAMWLSDSDSDSGGSECSALDRDLRLAGQYQQYHEQYHEQYPPTTTDLLGVGCIFPGASGSQAAVSAAGKAEPHVRLLFALVVLHAACMFACRFSLVVLQGCAACVGMVKPCACVPLMCVCVCQLQAAITLPLAQATAASSASLSHTPAPASPTPTSSQPRLPLHPHSAHYPSPKQPSPALLIPP